MSTQNAYTFLKSLAGSWRDISQNDDNMKGVSENKLIGENWLALDTVAEMRGNQIHGRLLLGYDVAKGRFVGAGVNSAAASMTHMEGWLETPATLVLEYLGPGQGDDHGKMVPFRDITRVESPERYRCTSLAKSRDGEWIPYFETVHNRVGRANPV
jgi:hypothetical protein